MARLGDVCEKVTDYVASGSFAALKENVLITNEENYAIMVKTADFSNGFTKGLTYTDKHGYDFLRNSNLFGGELILSNIGSIGKVFKVPYLDRPMTLASNTVMIKTATPELTDYLYYYFLSPAGYKNLLSISSGTSMLKFNKTELKKLEVPVPNVDKQRHIIAVMDKVTELITLRKEQLAKLDQLVKSRFIELFGDPMTNSHGYALKKYGDLFELNAGGTPSKQKPEYWENGTISWIGSNMCQNTVIYENDGNYITEEGLKHSSARMFSVDTVLIALVGATIGKTALLKFETTTNQNVLGVREIRENGYTPEFVFYYTQGLYQKFLNIGDGGFAMASKGFISELPIPIVDLELQEQFTAFVEQTGKSKLAIQQSLDKLELLKKSLMQQYFG